MFLKHVTKKAFRRTEMIQLVSMRIINSLNAELNPICQLASLVAHPILHISRIRVNVWF
jgi:hypothetical protein